MIANASYIYTLYIYPESDGLMYVAPHCISHCTHAIKQPSRLEPSDATYGTVINKLIQKLIHSIVFLLNVPTRVHGSMTLRRQISEWLVDFLDRRERASGN